MPAKDVEVHIQGDQRIAALAGDQLIPQLSAFLGLARLSGEFAATVSSKTVPGTKLTKGLMVGNIDEESRSVRIFWQDPKSDQGPRIPLMLKLPDDTDPRRCVMRLREALPLYIEAAKNGGAAHADAPRPHPAMAREAAPKPPKGPSIDTERFFAEVERFVSRDGFVAARACEKVLKEIFGIAEHAMTDVLHDLIAQRLILVGSDEGTLRVPAARRPAGSPGARKKPIKPVKEGEILDQLPELERQAKELPNLEQGLADLDQRVENLEKRIIRLCDQERPKIVAQIEACKGAVETLDRLKEEVQRLASEE